MGTVFLWWGICALVLLVLAGAAGQVIKQNVLGILIDNRDRMSLSRFQMTLWTIVILSLLAGVFLARLFDGVVAPLKFTIPNELLVVMGISVGSAVSATAIKASKDLRASYPGSSVKLILGPGSALSVSTRGISTGAPNFWQLFLTEEGSVETIDITKFQNFWLTLILVVSYIAATASTIGALPALANLTTLPNFDPSQVYLLGISHAGYLAGKLPDRQ